MLDRLERLLYWHRRKKKREELSGGLCAVGGPYHHFFDFHLENGHQLVLALDGPRRLRK